MPCFRYIISRADDTRTVELRRSNPQGWLLDAVQESYPEIAARRNADIIRLRLHKSDENREVWKAILSDGPYDLSIEVVKLKT